MTLPRPLRRWAAVCALAAATLLTGCGQYKLIGKVIEGDLTTATFVPADDPAIAVPGVSGAHVSILRDPDTPKRAIAGSAVADSLGFFEMPIDGVGAGWMVEDWLIRAERSGYAPAAARVALPANPKRFYLLITIRRGEGSSLDNERENLWEEVERYR
jgi:hypothetical protein